MLCLPRSLYHRGFRLPPAAPTTDVEGDPASATGAAAASGRGPRGGGGRLPERHEAHEDEVRTMTSAGAARARRRLTKQRSTPCIGHAAFMVAPRPFSVYGAKPCQRTLLIPDGEARGAGPRSSPRSICLRLSPASGRSDST